MPGKANVVLKKFQAWSVTNALLINTGKTKALLYKAKNVSYTLNQTLTLGRNVINIASEVKTLGVTFIEFMLWDAHIETLTGKLSRTLGILRRFQNTLPQNTKRLIYFALFVSHTIYCHLMWGTTMITNMNKLITVR